MSRCSTPEADFSPDELRRFHFPWEYPCYNLEGEYKPMSNCRERCCILHSSDDEDTPKWKSTLAARQQRESPMARQE